MRLGAQMSLVWLLLVLVHSSSHTCGDRVSLPRADEDFQTDIVNPDVKAAMQVIKETNSTEK